MPNLHKAAEQVFRQHRGVMRMATAIKAGIHRRTLYEMLADGTIERLSRGLYKLSGTVPLAHPDLVTVSLRIPQGVVCLISALSYHEITTEIPHEIYVAIPSQARWPKINYPPVRAFRFSGKNYSEGIETHQLDRVPVKIYSREKTLADCFLYRNKIGLDTCIEALRFYLRQRPINLDKLMEFAKMRRVAKLVQHYLEAML